jgi:hypothetical protein
VKRDAQGLEINLGRVPQGHRDDGWVAPVNPGDDRQHRVEVCYGSRQRADLPERIKRSTGAGEVAGARNAASPFSASAGTTWIASSRFNTNGW